jgi:hypothetical protein
LRTSELERLNANFAQTIDRVSWIPFLANHQFNQLQLAKLPQAIGQKYTNTATQKYRNTSTLILIKDQDLRGDEGPNQDSVGSVGSEFGE